MDLGGDELRRRLRLGHRGRAAGIEDVLLGAIPGLPKVHLHNKVLSPTLGGEEFLSRSATRRAATLDAPFVLVIEGSIPNEKINGDGYWTSIGNDEATGEPLTT